METFIGPLTGLPVQHYTTGCGSFAVHGFNGSTDDLVTRGYLTCERSGQFPTLVKMAMDVAFAYVRTHARHCFHIDHSMSMREIVDYVAAQIVRNASCAGEQIRMYSADVRFDGLLPDGSVVFYIGDEVVGELSGFLFP